MIDHVNEKCKLLPGFLPSYFSLPNLQSGEELERVAKEKGGVRTQNRRGGVMTGRGGLV